MRQYKHQVLVNYSVTVNEIANLQMDFFSKILLDFSW